MALRVKRVTEAGAAALAGYCAEHGPEHDESFLPGRDFTLSPEYPAYLLWKDPLLVGSVVLMRTSRLLSAHRGRFSIFHSLLNTREAYSALLEAIRPHFSDLRSVYLFIPETKHDTANILSQLGFHIGRFSFVLERSEPTVRALHFPHGYVVHPLDPSDRVRIRQFAHCLNQSFAQLAGHTDVSSDDIRAWFDAEGYLDGGICLLTRGEEPVGTLRFTKEDEERHSGEVSALGIVKEHRGQGLGRALLRYGVALLLQGGLHPVYLSVHAENEAALGLYKSEGFTPTKTMVCYELDCA